jgi:hypothetical protein
MDVPTAHLVEALTFLLPGFITASIYFALTPAPRPIPFERIVQALIFTMVVQASLFAIRESSFGLSALGIVLGRWTSEVQLVWSVILGLLLGLLLAWTSNRDKVHALLRRLGITTQTSFASEWYGALCRNNGYVVLHLKGNRRLYGWPEEWPSVAECGHFVIAKGEWLDEDRRIELAGVDRILIRADEVEMVELMSVTTTPNSEIENG